ncbi:MULTISPECIES: type II toxin-antitoxin system VapC family toxin [unclassified Nostoc]|uniref:type II toxin-antitoxin system VapC family toxin n=1 Tax=unclassified Nostoc TaxID=2593658 RepID=UPI000B950E96|nr:PIN domain-containing protein [Nostoc sp. 'Peltigera membranacea cyanobiont' 232]OYE02645.1 VapC toxin family PIN domain ribonuclease [Nostoc sp. 'Peltigera membranacea cyanobiont' 232]
MLLLDTSGLLCYVHSGEPEHEKAVEFLDNVNVSLTHSYVLAEFIALSQVRRFPRTAALQFIIDLLENPDIEMVWIDELLHREAVKLLMARQDKTYSLCDAVSFVLMRQRGFTQALTTDRHFEQEGFRRLLLPQV